MVKVTVVIPSYNVEEYIEECIVSVLNQSLKDIEIILVNDGSEDNTLNIIKEYAKKDKRVRYIDQEHQGPASRNYALDIAEGEYVFFLDSDDYIPKQALEKLYEKASNDNLDVLYFDAESVYENEKLKNENKVFDTYYKRKKEYSKVYDGQELFVEMRKNGEFRPNACFQMVKLSFLNENKIRFVEGIIHEDECFGLEVSLLAKRASHILYDAYIRRVRNESIMTSSRALKRSYGYFKTIMVISDYIEKNVDKKYFNYYYIYLNGLKKSSSKFFNECVDKCELDEFVKNLPINDRLFYKLLIETYGRKEEEIEQLNDDIKKLKADLKKYRSLKSNLKTKCKSGLIRVKRKINSKKNIKISIIIPVYNCEKFLDECLTSLINQTLKEIEIICIDDSSTDSSYDILTKYQKKDKRIKVFRQEHSNAGKARNLGITKARGEYLLFLDSDDYFNENLCSKAYKAASKNDAQIVLFSATKIDEKTHETKKINYLLDRSIVPLKKVYSSENIAMRLYGSSTSAPWSKLFERKFIIDNDLKFQELPNSNDVFFTRMSFSLAERFYAFDEELVYYRFNHGTNTQSLKHKEPLSFIKAYTKLREELMKRNIFDKYYQTYLNTVIRETVFNYNSTNSKEAQKEIFDYLKKQGFEELGIKNFDEKLVYDEENLNKFKEIFGSTKTSK